MNNNHLIKFSLTSSGKIVNQNHWQAIDTPIVKWWGKLENHAELAKQLGIAEPASTEALILKAYLQLGDKWAQSLSGDFSCVIISERKLTIFKSVCSSHAIFFEAKDESIGISDTLSAFKDKQQVNPSALIELIHWGYITGAQTLLSSVNQIEVGQCCQWQYCNGQWQQSNAIMSRIEPIDLQILNDVNSNLDFGSNALADFQGLFNDIPEASLLQFSPISHAAQLNCFTQLQSNDEKCLTSNFGFEAWTNCGFAYQPEQFDVNRCYWINWMRQNQVKQYLKQRLQELALQQQTLGEEHWPCKQWMDIRYGAPYIQSGMQSTAKALHKRINFSLNTLIARKDNEFTAQAIQQEAKQTKTNNEISSKARLDWSLDADPMQNLWESMQRLFFNGYAQLTKKVLHFAPPIMGKVVLKHQDNESLRLFSVMTLSLDYLARFHQWNFAELQPASQQTQDDLAKSSNH